MIIYLGADHRGFNLKERLKDFLKNQGYEIFDAGNVRYDEADDYPDFAAALAQKISKDPDGSRGILICGSGVGVDVAANKFRGVRSALAISADQVYDARHDDNVNVLSLAADFTSEGDAEKLVQTFIETPFAEKEERFARRIEKIAQMENL